MNVSDCVDLALKRVKAKKADLCGFFGISSPSGLSNKFAKGRWTAEELARVAEYTGGKLKIVYPDGMEIPVTPSSENGDGAQQDS